MLFTKKLYQIATILCLTVMLISDTSLVFAAQAPADPIITATPTPLPTPTIPPTFYEPIQTDATNGWPAGPAVYSESAIVMDANTGTVLYAKNINDQKYPASITKIMTALVAIENSKPNERVIFSDNAIWGIERNSSHIGIRIGENLSMEECLYGMMLASANEVCIAVAEHIGGDVPTFVEMMNKKAAELGCTGTHFSNPNGLPDENHYTTAADMALISREAFKNELFREITRTKAYKIGWTNLTGEDRWLGNHHKMLWDNNSNYYESCVGGKTGYTDVALNTLVTYATRDEKDLLCVSMRTAGQRIYSDTAAMLDYGFQSFQNVTLPNTKKTDYGVYLMPFPSMLLGCYSPQTHDDLLRNNTVSIPAEGTADEVKSDDVIDDENALIKRSFLYNDYEVGSDVIHQPPGIKRVASLGARFVDSNFLPTPLPTPAPITGLDSVKEKATSAINAFDELPSWKYPLVALLGLLLILIIVKISFAIKRSKRKKKRRNKNK